MGIRVVVEVVERVEGGVTHGGVDERDGQVFNTAKEVVLAKSGGERVVADESGGECGGNDLERVVNDGGGGGGGGVEVGAEVTEGDVEVGVGVEMGKREGVVFVEWWCGGRY